MPRMRISEMNWLKRLVPEGRLGVRLLGHRTYVGGRWNELGLLQFNFLVDHGLKPHHYLLDIGCGALRGGVRFINYLEPGHYMGADRETALLTAGIEKELGLETYQLQRPYLFVTDRFDFSSVPQRPDFVLAISLFTHLTLDDIANCLDSVRTVSKPSTVLYASFFEGNSRHASSSGTHLNFYHQTADLERAAVRTGWISSGVCEWAHPRHQRMLKLTVKACS